MGRILSLVVIFSTLITSVAHARESQFTQEDRERLVRLEVRVDEGFKAIQKQIDDNKAALSDLKSTIQWLFSLLFGGMLAMIGFVIWDRRTALAPAIKRTADLEDALRRAAKKDHVLAEALKHAGLL